jgi:hypothetical protein
MVMEKEFALTRSIYPYRVYIIAGIIVTALSLFDAVTMHDINFIAMSGLLWLVLLATQYGNTRYRIFWHDGEIKQISANKYITTIDTSEIITIGQESAGLQERLRLRRPADRIAIYAEKNGKTKHIDVSLRHFVAADIRKLMHAIHEQRPDLAIPKGWI